MSDNDPNEAASAFLKLSESMIRSVESLQEQIMVWQPVIQRLTKVLPLMERMASEFERLEAEEMRKNMDHKKSTWPEA